MRQGDQQCQRDTIIEKTFTFQERGKPLADAELAEGRQHSDRISRGNRSPEKQRHGPRQPECPMHERATDDHRQQYAGNSERNDARSHAPQETQIEDERGLEQKGRQKQKQNDLRAERWCREGRERPQAETQEQ